MATSTTPPHRLLLLTAIAAGLGVAGGGAAWVLLHLIGLITNLALFRRAGWQVPPFDHLARTPVIPIAAVCGALLVSLLARWAPVIRGHGIPEAMEVILTRQSRIAPRAAVAKPLSAAIAIGTGGPFGAEGPIIVTGGAIGSLVGQLVPVSPSERKILLACGAAAGMAATFGAPLAAVVLAIELLLFEFTTRAFVPLAMAAAVAAAMHDRLLGAGPLFAVPAHRFPGLASLPAFAVLGVACGLVAVLVARGLFVFEAGFRRLPVGEFWHPVIGAVGFATVGLAVPRVLGVGYAVIGDILHNRLAVATVAVLAGAKLVAWWIALASGTSGGTLAPILLVSAGFGSLFGAAVERLMPNLGVTPSACALVAMAAVFGAATRAGLTGIVFVFELTRDYQSVVPLMVATVLADLVAATMLDESIMTDKLARRGLRVSNEYEVDVLRTARIGDIMSADVETLPASATVGDARDRMAAGRHGAYPIIGADGSPLAIVSRGDLLRDGAGDGDALIDHCSRDLVTVGPDDTAVTALHLMLEEGIEHVPVLSGGALVGIVTRTDLLRVRGDRLAHEQTQHGALAPVARRIGRHAGQALDRVVPRRRGDSGP